MSTGSAQFARAFREDHLQGVECTLLCDPEGESFGALGFRRNLRDLLQPTVLLRAVRAWTAGYRQSSLQGDALQNGGVVRTDGAGAIVYFYASQGPGDHPSPSSCFPFGKPPC